MKQQQPILVIFGLFGERIYTDYQIMDGAAKIPCRWCVGEGQPTTDCRACKKTGSMLVGL